jgi:hypothetical protein
VSADSVRFMALLLSTSLSAGCATVMARGVVRGADGRPVPDATIRVRASGEREPFLAAKSEADGCFNARELAPRGARRFTIELSAPGRKPISLETGTTSPILLVLLEPDSVDEASAVRPMTAAERSALWEPVCAAAIPRAASSLAP